jgi:catechol 2,3-dioxygenase-like lactoylglutathione lyase family enzyme
MAKIKRIDHVAIAVKDADEATQKFVKLLNAVHIRTEVLQEKPLRSLTFGDNVISLIRRWKGRSKHIAKHEGMHHMALKSITQ